MQFKILKVFANLQESIFSLSLAYAHIWASLLFSCFYQFSVHSASRFEGPNKSLDHPIGKLWMQLQNLMTKQCGRAEDEDKGQNTYHNVFRVKIFVYSPFYVQNKKEVSNQQQNVRDYDFVECERYTLFLFIFRQNNSGALLNLSMFNYECEQQH